jgi:Tol biopolymer transport system component
MVPVSGGTPRALIKSTPPKDAKTPAIDAPIGVPSWSPDGKTIAYTGQSGALYLVNVSDGKQKANLTALKFFSADWSPDGKQLVAFAQDADNKVGIFTLNSDGTNMQLLVSLSAADVTFALASDHFFARDTVLPRWSPDGKQITYAAITSGGSIPSVYRIANSAGTAPTLISDSKTTAYGASWSPDGKYLAYMTEDGDQRAITLIDLSQPRFGPIVELRTGGCPVWKPGK